MKQRAFIKAALLALSALTATSASADTVTFDDVPIYSNQPDFSSDGFNFSSGEWIGYVADGRYCTPACPYNGTNVFVAGIAPSALTMTSAAGTAFNFKGFDGGGGSNFNLSSDPDFVSFIPTQIDVVGYRADGQTVSQSFLIDRSSNADGRLNLTSFAADSRFSNVVSVTFSASGSSWEGMNTFTLDNIVTSAVPEPSMGYLFLAGAGLVAGAVRRRRSKAV